MSTPSPTASDGDREDADPSLNRPCPPTTVLRAVPGTAPEWTRAADQISSLLLTLAAAENAGHAMPEPLRAGRALRAWTRLEAPLLTAVRAANPVPVVVAVLVPVSDTDILGATARLLGRVLCEFRVHSTGGEIARTLLHTARAQDTTLELLVAQLARVHGVLDVDPCDADAHADLVQAVWRAGA
jgi:hypothetical protein